MKVKYHWGYILLIAILIFSTACSNNESFYVYELNTGNLAGDNEYGIVHNYSFDSAPTVSVKNDMEDKTIVINGNEKELEYVKTYYYTLGDYYADQYGIKNSKDDEASVLLSAKDGSLFAVFHEPICSLKLSKGIGIESVKELLIDELGDFLSFNDYEKVKYTTSIPYTEGGKFGAVHFVWYNEINGIMIDSMRMSVIEETGEVNGLSITPKINGVIPEDISISNDLYPKRDDFNKTEISIYNKIASIYNNAKVSLTDCRIESSRIIEFHGGTALSVTADVGFKTRKDRLSHSEAVTLIVPFE